MIAGVKFIDGFDECKIKWERRLVWTFDRFAANMICQSRGILNMSGSGEIL